MSTEIGITVHGLSSAASAIELIDSSGISESSKRKYTKALGDYLEYGQLTNPHALANYANQLPTSTARHLQAAVSKWATLQKKQLRNMATPDNLAHVQAMMFRLDGIGEAIEVKATKGEKAHIWLTPIEQDKLLATVANGSLISKRDEVLIRLMLATGLRRNEVTTVKFSDVVTMGTVPVLEVIGKGSKRRQIPIGSKLASFLENWRNIIESPRGGAVLRSVSQSNKIGDSLSGVSVYRIVNKYGRIIGKDELAPHDLRRTFAENLRRNGIDIVTISSQLGHESIETTKRYLNVDVDLSVIGADYLSW